MQYENGKSRIPQGLSHIRFKKQKENDCALWKMHAIEKATEPVMWGVQFTYNVKIVEEVYLHQVRKKNPKSRFPNMLCKELEGGFSKVWPS